MQPVSTSSFCQYNFEAKFVPKRLHKIVKDYEYFSKLPFCHPIRYVPHEIAPDTCQAVILKEGLVSHVYASNHKVCLANKQLLHFKTN